MIFGNSGLGEGIGAPNQVFTRTYSYVDNTTTNNPALHSASFVGFIISDELCAIDRGFLAALFVDSVCVPFSLSLR